MKITKMISQNLAHFTAEYGCEGCGNTQVDNSGYNDKYYHENVIPNIQCNNCGESTTTLGVSIVPSFVSCKEMTTEERIKRLEKAVAKLVVRETNKQRDSETDAEFQSMENEFRNGC